MQHLWPWQESRKRSLPGAVLMLHLSLFHGAWNPCIVRLTFLYALVYTIVNAELTVETLPPDEWLSLVKDSAVFGSALVGFCI